MSYTKITDLSVKDVLLTGNPAKIIKGTELDAEFNAIAAADAINVKGPVGTSTDNAVVRWDTSTGRAVQDSVVTVSDTGVVGAYDFNGGVGLTTTHPGKFTTLRADGVTDLWGAVNAIAGVTVSTGAPTSSVTTGELNINSPSAGNGLNVNGDNGGNISIYNNGALSGAITAGAGATYMKLDSGTGTGFRLQTDVSSYLGAIRGFVTGNEKIRVDASGLNVYGGASVSGNLSNTGSLTVGTTANIGTDITVGGASSVGSETVRGNLTVLGTLTATGMSTGTNESLVALANSMHFGAIVKAILYDTGKDSDGGAWRKRCTDKSWYTETLGFSGTWGGQAASNAAGWAACGSVTGGAYQSTADGKFYTPTSASTQTEIFRGNAREFPEQVAIVAETGRVVIYDLTQVGTPIWMVFTAANGHNLIAQTCSSLAVMNGHLVVGQNAVGALCHIDFVRDYGYVRVAATTEYNGKNIAARNSGTVEIITGTTVALVNRVVNDVAITVLDTAPIDPATGLPVPTIAVATAGGVSVIKDDGTVVNSSESSTTPTVYFSGNTLLRQYSNNLSTHKYPSYLSAAFVASNSYGIATIPAHTNDTKGKGVPANLNFVTAGSTSLVLTKENPAVQAKGMVSYITNAYNSGWLPGDIRGAYLADTTAETITASGELATATYATVATFDNTVSGVTASGFTAVAGTTQTRVYVNLTTVVGKTYLITFKNDSVTSGGVGVYVRSAAAMGGSELITPISSVVGTTYTPNFVATSTTSSIGFVNVTLASGFVMSGVSVKLADPDRSVKNTGLVPNGSLTKTAVASGAGLVAYSGFSASNYLEQPYNANLDFGTGDFCVMGWVNLTSVSTIQVLLSRSTSGSAGGIDIRVNATGFLEVYLTATTSYALILTSTVALTTNTLTHIEVDRASGTLTIRFNGLSVGTVANSTNITFASTVLRVGLSTVGTSPTLGSLALWRISATAPSADQIAHIYRTELPLFQANAQCTIAGTSTAVTALAYDDVADTLHVGTSWGRTAFRDLLRVDSEATTTGALTSLSANEGAVVTGGATTGKVNQPAMKFRDELRRKDIARKALGKIPVPFDYTATASQTAFVLPKGYTAKTFQKNGTFVRETTGTPNFVRSDDGFQETCTLSAGATVGDWIQIMAVRK